MNRFVNLLPDSKIEREKAQRTRQLAITTATIVAVIAVAIPILLFALKGGQKLLLNRIQSQIDSRKSELKLTENIATMLTVKDHMSSLTSLYDQRVITTEFMSFLPAVLPQEVRLTNIEMNLAGSSISFSGTAPTYSSGDKFYKALLFAGLGSDTAQVDPDPNLNGMFTNVVLNDVSGPSGSEVTFTITANFSPELIDGKTDE